MRDAHRLLAPAFSLVTTRRLAVAKAKPTEGRLEPKQRGRGRSTSAPECETEAKLSPLPSSRPPKGKLFRRHRVRRREQGRWMPDDTRVHDGRDLSRGGRTRADHRCNAGVSLPLARQGRRSYGARQTRTAAGIDSSWDSAIRRDAAMRSAASKGPNRTGSQIVLP